MSSLSSCGFRDKPHFVTQSSDEKRVVDIRHRLDSVGLAQEQGKTLCLGKMRTSAYLLHFFR